jgi:protein-S-isoprenylcysteine O-methyltransferase Ste14
MSSVQTGTEGEARPQRGAIQRTAVLLYGTAVYVLFFATFVYFIAFVGNFFVPKSVDVGPTVPVARAVVIDLLLATVFAVQHTIMARPRFKIWLTKSIPQPAERSTFVLAATLALILLMALWRPIEGVLWDVSGGMLASILIGISLIGWGILFWSTFLINHFDLFGFRQVVLCFQGKQYEPVKFTTPVLYRYVRHPMYVGLFIAIWVTPTMTIGHLVFAGALTLYTVIGIQFEERELARHHGESYREYQRQVSMLMPRPPKK